MLRLRVFVADEPVADETARTVNAVRAAAGRFPGQVEVEVWSLASPEAAALGLSVSPTILEGETVLVVGGPLSAGRLKRYLENQLGASGDRPAGPGE